jgi:hypothetical protein
MRVVGRHTTFEKSKRALVEHRGFGLVSPSPADDTERAERGHELDVVGAEVPLLDGEGAAQSTLGALKLSESRIDDAQAADGDAGLIVIAAQRALEHDERTLEQLRCLGVTACGVKARSERGAIGGGLWVIRPDRRRADRDGSSGRGLAPCRSPGRVGEAADSRRRGAPAACCGARAGGTREVEPPARRMRFRGSAWHHDTLRSWLGARTRLSVRRGHAAPRVRRTA